MTMANPNTLLPLTHPQKRIWYIEQLYPGTTVHHICGTALMKGEVDIERLSEALALVLRRHDALRMRLVTVEGDIYQSIHNPVKPDLPHFDSRHSRHPEQALHTWLQELIRQPFELLAHELYQFAIFRTAEGETGLFVKIHHLVFDGWSTQLFTRELSRCYAALSKPGCASLPDIADIAYLGLHDREQAYLASPRMERDRQFWLTQFDEVPPLPFRDSPDWRKGGRWSIELPEALCERTLEWVEQNGVSLHELFGLLLQMTMYSHYGVADFTLGVPVYNRTTSAEKEAVGMYTSTMPLRCVLDAERTPVEQLQVLRRLFRQGYLHQKYPYDLLVQQLRGQLPDGDAMFQVCLNTYVFNPHETLAGSPLYIEELYKGDQLYPLELIVKNWSGGQLQLDLDYKLALFTRKQVKALGKRLQALLEQVLRQPEAPLHELAALAEHEVAAEPLQQLPSQTVVEALAARASEAPQRIAVRDGGLTVTYGELLTRIQTMASWLAEHGVDCGDRVGLYSEHRLDSVTAIWAILSLGAAYVPMDVRHPAGRIADVLSDSDCAAIVADRELPAESLEQAVGAAVLRLDQWTPPAPTADGEVKPERELPGASGPDELAYLIYTSGSTGKPKGVMIKHSSLLDYALWAAERYMRDEDDVFALYSSPAFDLTVTSIFAPLVAGAQIDIYRERQGTASVLPEILAASRATVIKLTPAHLAWLAEAPAAAASVHTLIVGGEALGTPLAKAAVGALGGVRLYNEYGPTEATVGCMIHLFDSQSDREAHVPIGHGAAHARIYLLRPDGSEAAVGEIGELVIAGTGVAAGYRGREELTRSRFLPEPGHPGSRMYRSGDLAVRDEAGMYRYLGRIDDQIKLRGYRIEPAEIERSLLGQQGVKEAAVVLGEPGEGQSTLIGYITGESVAAEEELRRALVARLPDYMVPAHILRLPALPLTPGGKVDRRALALKDVQSPKAAASMMAEHAEAGSAAGAADGTDRLETLLTVAGGLLRNPHLSEGDDFYREGGDSIKAIQLASRLQDQGWRLAPSEILEAAVLGSIAERMEPLGQSAPDGPPLTGTLRLPPIAAWFFEQDLPVPDYWNQSVLLTLDERITPSMIDEALTIIVRRHDALRLNVKPGTEDAAASLYYSPDSLGRRFGSSRSDLSGLAGVTQAAALERACVACKNSLDLEAGLLLAACWLDLGEGGQRLLLTAHHLVVDSVSWLILTEDLERLLAAMLQGRRPELAHRSASYGEWVDTLVERAARLQPEDLAFWTAGAGDMPADAEAGDSASWRVAAGSPPTSGQCVLGTEETARWLGPANRTYRTEPVELLLAALAVALASDSGTGEQHPLVIQMEHHGRTPASGALDLTRTVGWFTNLYPLALERHMLDAAIVLSGEAEGAAGMDGERVSQAVTYVKERSRSVPRQGSDYGIARYMTERLRLAGPSSDTGVIFNYLGELTTGGSGQLIRLAQEASGSDTHPANGSVSRIEALAWVAEERLCLTVRLREGGEAAAGRLAATWSTVLRQLVDHCMAAEVRGFTPSDFDMVQLSQDELEGLFDV
ncbi:amino acid adenylation domain-containing protein [Paenibacillus sp. 1P07SE]|uniref:amino acid adenylation domain-containing protein n=1 Tax=Paenibacillus sp. 1P07SE TaxID=3132209 RepID=UPI0039A7614B